MAAPPAPMHFQASITFIAGDIGGTNSRLQLWQRLAPSVDTAGVASPRGSSSSASPAPTGSGSGVHEREVLVAERIYPSQKFTSLTFIIEKFLKEVTAEKGAGSEFHPIACCLAVAGPVRANKAQITNVAWVLDGAEMARALRIPDVLIINDFVAVGYGLLALSRDDVIAINDVPLADEAPKACLGAGTGLGEVYLTAGHLLSSTTEAESLDGSGKQNVRTEAEYNVWASEGGHADFAPRDKIEFELLEFFKKNERVTRVSVERIVSGMGIPKIYEFFAHHYPEEVNDAVTEKLRVGDPGAIIAEYAENGECNLCRQTIELFVKCYGAEAGNLALKMLPFGGLYIGGGIAPKLKSFLLHDNLFWRSFVQKGRMQALLEKVPVFIVTHPSVGLLGAKVVCRRLLRKQGFLPGRGELPSWSDATPRALSQGLAESFAFPLTAGIGDGAYAGQASGAFETEVTLRADGSNQPEKVLIRRRTNTAHQVPSQQQLQQQQPSESMARQAFKAGLLGGAIASVISVAAVAAITFLSASRRNAQA